MNCPHSGGKDSGLPGSLGPRDVTAAQSFERSAATAAATVHTVPPRPMTSPDGDARQSVDVYVDIQL